MNLSMQLQENIIPAKLVFRRQDVSKPSQPRSTKLDNHSQWDAYDAAQFNNIEHDRTKALFTIVGVVLGILVLGWETGFIKH